MNLEGYTQELDYLLTNSDSVGIEKFDNLLINNPGDGYLIGMKVRELLSYNNFIEAGKYFEIKISEYPALIKNSYCLMSKALLLEGKQREILLEQALKFDANKNNKWLRLELYSYYKNLDEEIANHYLVEALEIDEEFTHAQIEMSYLLDQADYCKNIIEILSNVILRYENEDIHIHLGGAYLNCGDVEKSENHLNRAIEIKPVSDAYYILGVIYQDSKLDSEKAIEYYNKGLEIDVKNTLILNSLGWLYYDLNKLNEALACFKFLAGIKHESHYNQLIRFYILTENIEVAKELNYSNERVEITDAFYLEGFDKVFSWLKDGVNEYDYQDFVISFEAKYGYSIANWFEEEFHDIFIQTEKKN